MKASDQRRFTILRGKQLRADATKTLLAISEAWAIVDEDTPPQIVRALRMAQRTLTDLRQPQSRPNAKRIVTDAQVKQWYRFYRNKTSIRTPAVKSTAAKLGICETAVWNRLKALRIDW